MKIENIAEYIQALEYVHKLQAERDCRSHTRDTQAAEARIVWLSDKIADFEHYQQIPPPNPKCL